MKLNLIDCGEAEPILSNSDVIIPSDEYEALQATADRRGRLMLKQDKKIKVCQFCYRHLKWSKDIQRMVGHAEDCEWGQELADDNA